jgi:hypothetical protein
MASRSYSLYSGGGFTWADMVASVMDRFCGVETFVIADQLFNTCYDPCPKYLTSIIKIRVEFIIFSTYIKRHA